MAKITILQRPLKNNEIDDLIRDIKEFPDLVYISKKIWQKHTNHYVVEINDTFAGVCVVYNLENWIKIGPLAILKKFHGQGAGKGLLKRIIFDNKKNLFIASSNPIVQQMVKKFGFKEVKNYLSLPGELQFFVIKQILEYLNLQLISEFFRKKKGTKRQPLIYFLLSR